MGASKKDIYSEEQMQIANIFKALSNPARISIIENLIRSDNKQIGGILDAINLSSSTILYHIEELSKVGLLKVCEDKKQSNLVILHEPLDLIEKYCNAAIEIFEKQGLEFEYLYVPEDRYYIKKVKFKDS